MMKNTRLKIILGLVAIILLIPLIAMQFTDEITWTFFDFVAMGILLLGAGLLCELILRRVILKVYRIALCLAVLATFIVVWIELAVGIFGTPFGGQ